MVKLNGQNNQVRGVKIVKVSKRAAVGMQLHGLQVTQRLETLHMLNASPCVHTSHFGSLLPQRERLLSNCGIAAASDMQQHHSVDDSASNTLLGIRVEMKVVIAQKMHCRV